MLPNILLRLRQFKSSIAGNIAIVFALSLFPIIMSIGLSIDYSKTLDSKTRLDSYADTAALAGVNAAINIVKNAPEGSVTSSINSAAIAAGTLAAQNAFNSSALTVANTQNVVATVNLVRDGLKFNASVSYNAIALTSFGSLAGVNSFPLSNTVGAQSQLDPYLDIYIVIDNSGSMGVGATDADVALMNATNGLNCAFGCHIAGIRLNGAGLTNYEEAHNIGATLP